MSSISSQEYPFRIVSGLSPAESIPKMCSTARRRPRIIGFPPKIFGFTAILSINLFLSIKTSSEGHEAPSFRKISFYQKADPFSLEGPDGKRQKNKSDLAAVEESLSLAKAPIY
jgi:hypothetical protein